MSKNSFFFTPNARELFPLQLFKIGRNGANRIKKWHENYIVEVKDKESMQTRILKIIINLFTWMQKTIVNVMNENVCKIL